MIRKRWREKQCIEVLGPRTELLPICLYIRFRQWTVQRKGRIIPIDWGNPERFAHSGIVDVRLDIVRWFGMGVGPQRPEAGGEDDETA